MPLYFERYWPDFYNIKDYDYVAHEFYELTKLRFHKPVLILPQLEEQ